MYQRVMKPRFERPGRRQVRKVTRLLAQALRSAGRCEHKHLGPLVADQVEVGSVVVRCLACGTVGPERNTSEAARRALEDITAGQ
jgi:hypothetical protein